MTWEWCVAPGEPPESPAELIQMSLNAWASAADEDSRAESGYQACLASARSNWPHPCYLGASYLGCGWAWVYECSEYGSVGEHGCWCERTPLPGGMHSEPCCQRQPCQ